MNMRMSGAGSLVRLLLAAVFIGSLGFTTLQHASATQSGETSYDNTMVQIAACQLAGGTAEVDQEQRGNGFFATTVICHGGLLDGMVCMNNSGGTACYLLPRILSSDDELITPIDDLEVAPEPTEPPVIVDNGATDVVELLDEPTATPESTIDDGGLVVDQPVVDGGDSAPEPTATPGDEVSQGPVVDDSVVSDGGDVAPDPTRDPIVIEPQVNVEDITPIEVITLT